MGLFIVGMVVQEAFNEQRLCGNGGWLPVARDNLGAAQAGLTFRTGCRVTASVQTQISAAVQAH